MALIIEKISSMDNRELLGQHIYGYLLDEREKRHDPYAADIISRLYGGHEGLAEFVEKSREEIIRRMEKGEEK